MKVSILTDLVAEPVSLTEAKLWMRINDFTSDDTLITELIKSTRKHLEKFTGLSFGTKEIECTLKVDQLNFELPYSPVQSVISVEKWTGEDWEILVADTDYFVIDDTIEVYLKGKYRVNYQAGFTALPEDLKTDIKVLVAWQYENRGLKFAQTADNSLMMYPHWNLLNSRLYRKIVI
jgi:uncharacterized phiE125 gp8 family phage protein